MEIVEKGRDELMKREAAYQEECDATARTHKHNMQAALIVGKRQAEELATMRQQLEVRSQRPDLNPNPNPTNPNPTNPNPTNPNPN